MTRGPDLLTRTGLVLEPDRTRVAALLFLPGQEGAAGGESRSSAVMSRVLALSDPEVERELRRLAADFAPRHRDLGATWERHAQMIEHRLPAGALLTSLQRRLVGAYFTQEYTVEGASLTNPSMVPHPDQSGIPAGTTRFVMTMRAIGEGHVSSMTMRTGVVDAAGAVTLDPAPDLCVLPEAEPAQYSRTALGHQLAEHAENATTENEADAEFVLAALPATFRDADLKGALGDLHAQRLTRGSSGRTADRLARILASTYAVTFPADSSVAERVLMPRAPSERRGVEDVRMVRLVGPDGAAQYVGTYTAYDGHQVSIRLVRTPDFRRFSVAPLSGAGARNKGLALFPRQVGGRFLALSRPDRETNAVTSSADLLHWVHPTQIQVPSEPWEIIQLGNCGPPIETERGWLVLTHGVGPMRTYSIGALLLDLDEPTRVIGRLPRPLLTPEEDERSGYVPNVVYSCGAMLHGRRIVLPYGCSDDRTRVALVHLDALLDELEPPRRPRRPDPTYQEKP